MKTTINYERFAGDEKVDAALCDIKNYIGAMSYLRLVDEVKLGVPSPEMAKGVRFSLGMFAGIEGYPVVALLQHCWEMTEQDVIALLNAPNKEDN